MWKRLVVLMVCLIRYLLSTVHDVRKDAIYASTWRRKFQTVRRQSADTSMEENDC